jgi:chlorobactene glucosyltransferase
LIALAYLILLFWLLALGRTLLNLLLIRRITSGLTGAAPDERKTKLLSIIVPARNEERSIERTVRSLLAQSYTPLEVVVVNDRSTDATAAILARIAAHDPRLVVVTGEEPEPGWLGKPWALAEGSRRARGEMLLFVDADVTYARDAAAAAVAYLERSSAAMISLFPHFEMRGFWENLTMPALALTAFTYLPVWFGNRTTIARLAIGGGPGNLVRRSDYEAVGGHDALRDAVVDDVALARLLRRSGRSTELVRADDLVSLRMYHGLGEVVDGFTKNCFVAMGGSYGIALVLMTAMVIFHLLPYAFLFIPLLRLPALATVAVISLTRAVLFRSFRYRLDNALLMHPVMVVVWAWIFLRSVWFTGIRREVRWRGRTYDAGQTRFGAER